jgi:hypothetical protein
MSPSTITNIISNPDSFSPSEIASNSREALATDVLGKVNDRLGALSETGKEYQPLRQQSTPVNIPTGSVESVLQKHGITADSSGNLQFTKDSIPTSPADRAAIQDWYSTYGKDANHNSNSFLNARKGLDNLAQFDTAKTDAANVLARDLRSTWNKVGRPQVAGLENLDTKFSGETQQLQKVKTDYFNKDGTLKDNAVSKLANLSNAGRGSVLARLENIVPGVTKKIQTLKAVEDIQAAGGQKVGTYARAGLGVTGLATFNPAMIVSAIISEPHIATQILRGYGKLIGASPTIVEKAIGGIQSAATKEFFKPK